MKKIAISLLAMLAVSAQATVITDDFNRADAYASGTNTLAAIGNNWVGEGTRRWDIADNELQSNTGPGSFIYNAGLETLNSGDGASFTQTGTVALNKTVASAYGGMVVNFDTNTNFGVTFRISGTGSVQFLRPNGTAIASGTIAGFVYDRAYRMTVSSDIANTYDLEIYDPITSNVVYSTNNVVNAGTSASSDGYGGFYANTADVTYDDFSLETLDVTDGFNRADANGSGTATLTTIGNTWLGMGTRRWDIVDRELKSNTGPGNQIFYTGLKTMNAVAGDSFAQSGYVALHSTLGSVYGGLVVNGDTNAATAVTFRFSGTGAVQLLRPDGSIITSGSFSSTLVTGRFYRVSVSSDAVNTYDLEIYDPVADETVYSAENLVNSGTSVSSNGFGGFYASTANIRYDNFDLDFTQYVEPLEGYELWADSWGVPLGAATNDYDMDGLLNLAEYALGGNPTNALDRGTAPTLGFNGSSMVYLYPQRSDDASLSYIVKTTDDLVSGVWTNTGYAVDGTNVTGGTLDVVTNTVPVADPQLFIRLEIQQN